MVRHVSPGRTVQFGLCLVLLLPALACSRRPAHVEHASIISVEDGEQGPGFRLRFDANGAVSFQCIRMCAVPVFSWTTSPGTFDDLAQALRDASFLRSPRIIREPGSLTGGGIDVTCEDDAGIHEVVDQGKRPEAIRTIEQRVRSAGRADYFLKPSIKLYEEFLAHHADINAVSEHGESLLASAVWLGCDDCALYLLRRGAAVTSEPLLGAVQRKSGSLATTLLDAGPVDWQSPAGVRLIIAAARHNVGLMRLFRDRGANVNARNAETKETPLIAAVSDGALNSATQLIAKGADVNARDRAGRTALWHAAGNANSGFVTLLLQHGTKVDAGDEFGDTPLMVAARRCSYWTVEPLLKAGANPSFTNRFGRTSLQQISPSGYASCKTTLALLGGQARQP